METFSVLMSVYDKERPDFFELSLESNLVSQTLRPNEFILICDGNLTPELDAVIEKYKNQFPDILKVFCKAHEGLGKALNFGLEKCSNELIARSDSDDICKPDRFEKQVKFMTDNHEFSIISSWVDEFLEKPGDLERSRFVPEKPEDIVRYAKSRCPVNHPSVMFRKKDVTAVGGYQVKYFPEDYFLWIKMLQNGCKFYNIQESLVWFRSSIETFKRRGGWKYAVDEVKTQINIYRLGFISFPVFCKNVIIRFTTRIIPNKWRTWIYLNFLRK